MNMKITSIAELKRIPVGTRLRLVNSLIGPCDKPRTVKKVRSADIIMWTPEGTDSYLTLKGVSLSPTENGFRLFEKWDGGLCAEYRFED